MNRRHLFALPTASALAPLAPKLPRYAFVGPAFTPAEWSRWYGDRTTRDVDALFAQSNYEDIVWRYANV